MPDPTPPIKVDVVPIPPVKVAVIEGTSDGGLPLTHDTVAITPDHLPNVMIKVVTPIVAIVVRFGNLFGTQFVGLITAAMTPWGGKLLYTQDFLHMVVLCASLAFPGAAVGLAKDLVTIFGKLENRYPLATGSI
jgi:hypothetical protein